MPKINLLPWREQRREQQRKEFLTILGGVAGLGLAVVVVAHLVFTDEISNQHDRNQYLQQNITELDKKVVEIKGLQERRNQLIDRMKVIQDLQGTRPLIVHIFDEMARCLPDGVYFRSISRKDAVISIEGTAESNNRVSSLMRKLDASDWFAGPNLKSVKANPTFGEQANDFEMTVNITTPNLDAGSNKKEASEG